MLCTKNILNLTRIVEREENSLNKKIQSIHNVRWMLTIYDLLVLSAVDAFLLIVYSSRLTLTLRDIIINSLVAFLSIMFCRFTGGIYTQIWRYGGIQCYIRLMVTDFLATVLFLTAEYTLNDYLNYTIPGFSVMLAFMSMDLLIALAIRMVYRYCYKCGNDVTLYGKILNSILRIFTKVEVHKTNDFQKIKVAIVGAGNTGVSLAENLLGNTSSMYIPRCFIDVNNMKVGREIHGIPVFSEREATFEILKDYEIQEIVLAMSSVDAERKKELYKYYSQSGCKIKVYDYPLMRSADGKRELREFDVADLLGRNQIEVADKETNEYYKDKVVLITGGGGSIGSELCRQLAKMNPKKIVILDIYENGVYEVQQELKFKYGDKLELSVEIASITNKAAMCRVFEAHHPQIVINAAAHKHVPLMEHNCIEAIENNVFGTKVVIELCEEYGVDRFMMVSTDKAVNPTNVMGATKRMCEMIVQSASTKGIVKCSATRFGNVLGSAGSVIPLFKRQIADGGPVTITDKRITRYFMTIPEASQLVLQSGAMAKNGELFVLDMGEPVRILDLARNMINLSGVQGIEITETGLRPGEKLFEELLVKTEELDKTDNSLIFIERDVPLSYSEIEEKIAFLEKACATGDDDIAREALRQAVPTFKRPEDVNNTVHDEVDTEAQKLESPGFLNKKDKEPVKAV